MDLFVKLPLLKLSEGEKLTRGARRLFEVACARVLPPAPLPTAGLTPCYISLSSTELARVRLYGKTHNLSEGEAFAAGAYAASQSDLVLVPGDPNEERERLQGNLYSDIKAQLGHCRIILAEGGTGLGKSRILAKLALDQLPSGRVVVSSPTVLLMGQLGRELCAASRDQSSADIRPFPLLGRRQFVDPILLEEVLTEVPSKEVQEWMSRGGIGDCPSHMAFPLLKNAPWLIDSLQQVAPPDWPVDEVRLGQHIEDGPGLSSYQQLRELADEHELLFTTHSMLGVEILMAQRGRAGYCLPNETLLVDEAHDLEPILANILSHELSFFSLRTEFKRAQDSEWCQTATRKKLGEAVDIIGRIVGQLQTLTEGTLQREDPALAQVARVCEPLEALLGKLLASRHVEKAPNQFKTHLTDRLEVLKLIRKQSLPIVLSFSSVRKYVRLSVGLLSLRPAFETLWRGTGQAVLVSGTLSSHSTGNYSYFSGKLYIPRSREVCLQPVIPSWLSSPILHMPERSQAAAFSVQWDPEIAQKPTEAWCSSIAKALRHVHSGSRGGVLVLCGSFAEIESLRTQLSIPETIFQSASSTARQCKDHFVQAYRSGQKPLWLGTGSSWTGLDLRDELAGCAKEDFLLTDLVITRFPFAASSSTPHLARKAQGGFVYELLEACIKFRQGLGRLIRQPGVTHRQIWVLDGRMYQSYCAPLVKCLDLYTERRFLPENLV